MDFFQRQDKARSHTVLLSILFIVGLLATAFLIHCLIYGTSLILAEDETKRMLGTSEGRTGLFVCDMLAVCGFIALVALFKVASLNKAGPDGIAVSLGGSLVTRGHTEPCARRLYNVVEEIAIASGSPVPRVYILEHEHCINACAIGTSPENAAICVTQGAMDYLTRDELQGVIAHEFSHIVNNDVSLNTKLIGYLFGLEVIALIAAFVFRIVASSSTSVTTSSSKKDSGGAFIGILFLLLVSGTLFAIGCVGIFFGNIIRAAISRQREYLADASAVEFTRNPSGIAGALKKIGCPKLGSRVDNSSSVQASHMFFGSVFSQGFLDSLFQTHPDLDKRIKAIDPSFDGVFPKRVEKNDWTQIEKEELQGRATPSSRRDENAARKLASSFAGLASEVVAVPKPGTIADMASETVKLPSEARNASTLGFSRGQIYGEQFDHIVNASGSTASKSVGYGKTIVAAGVLEEVPEELENFLVDLAAAKAVFYAVLLGEDTNESRLQREILERDDNSVFRGKFGEACRMIAPLGDAAKLILARKATPLLKTASADEYRVFRAIVLKLCATDGVLDLFEYTLQASTIREMDLYYRLAKERKPLYTTFDQIEPQFATALSYLAYKGALHPGDEVKAFQAGVDSIGFDIKIVPASECSLLSCSRALNALYAASPSIKKTILQAFYKCVAYDGVVTEAEAAIVSAVTAALGAPAPIWRDWSV